MFMPGIITNMIKGKEGGKLSIKQKNYFLNIINDRDTLFIAEVNLSCSDELKNKLVNFPPIIRNIGIINSKDMIGE
jgi:hypothetical protein